MTPTNLPISLLFGVNAEAATKKKVKNIESKKEQKQRKERRIHSQTHTHSHTQCAAQKGNNRVNWGFI